MKVFNKVFSILEKVCIVLASIAICVVAAALFFQVIMRYFFNNATSWSDETATVFFVWSVMLSIPIGIRRHEHVSVEYFINKLPGKALTAVKVAISAVLAGTMAIVGFYALGLLPSAERQLLAGITLAVGFDVPMTIMYVAAPVGCAVSVLFCVERAVKDLLGVDQWEIEHPNEIAEIVAMPEKQQELIGADANLPEETKLGGEN